MVVLDQEVTAPLVEWRGPAPFYFLKLEEQVAKEILQVVKDLSYGWGVIPVTVQINKTEFETSIFQREDTLFVPVKKAARLSSGVVLGQQVRARLIFSTS
jgi:hypothetical protein